MLFDLCNCHRKIMVTTFLLIQILSNFKRYSNFTNPFLVSLLTFKILEMLHKPNHQDARNRKKTSPFHNRF